MESKKDYIDLLPEYFSGALSVEDRVAVEDWKNAVITSYSIHYTKLYELVAWCAGNSILHAHC